MNAYSKDLRLRVLEAVDRALPRTRISELFGVSLSTIKRYVRRRRQPGRGPRTQALHGTQTAHPCYLGAQTCPVGAARRERRGDPRTPLRAVGERNGC